MTLSIRALSLWRPWPWLILHAGKNVENRSWRTSYRGVIILHATRRFDWTPLLTGGHPHQMGFTGLAELTGMHHADECRTPSGLCSPWAAEGQWHWQLTRPAAFPETIAGPGAQGLFIPPPEAIEAAAAVRKEPV